MQNRIKKAFTLAEVLLVMGIIGIVAALSVSSLRTNIDDNVIVAKAKKTYTDLDTALGHAVIKYGVPTKWDLSNATVFAERITDYLDVDKACTNTNSASCWALDANVSNTFLLKDGASVRFFIDATKTGQGTLAVVFDIDGPNKGANTIGEDTFYASLPLSGNFTDFSLFPFYDKSFMNSSNTLPAMSNELVSNTSPAVANYLLWILEYNNVDYLRCPGTVKWITATTCN